MNGCNFCDKLARRYTRRGRELQPLSDVPLDHTGHTVTEWDFLLVPGHVEVSLIERDRFDEVGVFLEDFMDATGDFPIAVEIGGDANDMRTQPKGGAHWQGTPNAEGAGLVGGGSNNPTPFRCAADDDGLATQ